MLSSNNGFNERRMNVGLKNVNITRSTLPETDLPFSIVISVIHQLWPFYSSTLCLLLSQLVLLCHLHACTCIFDVGWHCNAEICGSYSYLQTGKVHPLTFFSSDRILGVSLWMASKFHDSRSSPGRPVSWRSWRAPHIYLFDTTCSIGIRSREGNN